MEITIKVEDNELLQRREAVVNAVSQILGVEPTQAPEPKKPEDIPPWEDEPKAPETAEEPQAAEPEITISDLRKKGTELTKAGKLPELQEVFAEFGAKKLSGLAEADYPAVMKRLEELK